MSGEPEAKPVPASWLVERPCQACGRPYTGPGRRQYCKNADCMTARAREKERRKRAAIKADPARRERINARQRNRYSTDPEFADYMRSKVKESYYKKQAEVKAAVASPRAS